MCFKINLIKNKRCCLNCTYLSINYDPLDNNSKYKMPDETNRNLYINDVNKLLNLQTPSKVQGYTQRNEDVKCHHDVWSFKNKPYFGLFEKPEKICTNKHNQAIIKERSKILTKRRSKGSCPFNKFNSYQSLEGSLKNMKFKGAYRDHRFNRSKEYILLIVTISTLSITIFNTFFKHSSTMYIKLLK